MRNDRIISSMAETVITGLQKRSVTSCSRYAMKYRIMGQPFPGPWSFQHHPWSEQMHDIDGDMYGQKAAQMAFTETALNRTFYMIDVRKVSCLYVLPNKTPDASDFSSARFDAALELSKYLRNLFSDTKNVGHKRAASVSLYIRGSRSRAGLKSVPAGHIVFDEEDEMTQENLPLAIERASGQMEASVWHISTPTIEDVGINKGFKSSTRNHYHFKCPVCSKYTEFVFPDSFVLIGDSLADPRLKESYKQTTCKHKITLPQDQTWQLFSDPGRIGNKALWVPQNYNGNGHGFHVNQLYSSTKLTSPAKIAEAMIKARSDPFAETELFNSKMGLPHLVEGARVTDTQLSSCVGIHNNGARAPSTLYKTMGIDVGTFFHYEVDAWEPTARNARSPDVNNLHHCRVTKIGKSKDLADVYNTIQEQNVNFIVIDGNPERRLSMEFVRNLQGQGRYCFYGNAVRGRDVNQSTDAEFVTVDRTSWLDLSIGRYKNKSITLPMDTPEEYKEHVKNMARVYHKDKHGNPAASYVNGEKADHYAHARNYSELALAVGASTQMQPTDIT